MRLKPDPLDPVGTGPQRLIARDDGRDGSIRLLAGLLPIPPGLSTCFCPMQFASAMNRPNRSVERKHERQQPLKSVVVLPVQQVA